MKYINLDAFRHAPLVNTPFPYLIVPNFIKQSELATLVNQYPSVPGPGSYPPNSLMMPPEFQQLIDEMKSIELQTAVGEKLSQNLTGKPVMVTIRGYCRATDGKIHRDSDSKIVTLLLYMNSTWAQDAGQLRLLENNHDLNAIITEVRPLAGTLLMFEVTPNSWHGHTSYEGPRHAIQMNYVTSKSILTKEVFRHQLSAIFKNLKSFFSYLR